MIREPRPAMVTGQRSGRLLLAEELLLGRPAGESESAPLLGVEPGAAELLLDVMGQRQVDVVAAEHQVIADGDAAEARPGGRLDHGDQAEVGRPAADVADQDQLAGRGPRAASGPCARRSSNRTRPGAPRAV